MTGQLFSGSLAAASLALLAAAPAALSAQAQPPQPPVITVSATGTVQATPDRATVMIGVETEAATAGEAGKVNATKQSAVLKAIAGLGIEASKIRTLNYSVSAVERWNDVLKRSEVVGYKVSNIVQVDADKVEQVGPIIDAALNSGANRIAGLTFRSSDLARHRDSALVQAVASAKRQAELAAKAAGGKVTELLGIDIVEARGMELREAAQSMMALAADAAPTPISEGSLQVTATVRTRWKFEPN